MSSSNSDYSAKAEKLANNNAHGHIVEQDEVDIAAKLTASAESDIPLSPEDAARLRYVLSNPYSL